MKRCSTALFAALVISATPAVASEREWQFQVFLDDKEIGRHEFLLDGAADNRRVVSKAEFEYKLLFVKLFDYQHRNTEQWQGDCLESIDARTDVNGKRFEVLGSAQGLSFSLQMPEASKPLADCVMSFAYWNPAFLGQERLLNSQNGEFLDVEFSDPEPDKRLVRGVEVSAVKYRLKAGEMDIRLWYSTDHEWLALETDARGGRLLRYELL